MTDSQPVGHRPGDGRQAYDPELARLHARSGNPSLGTFLIGDLASRRGLERSSETAWRLTYPHIEVREAVVERSDVTISLSVFRRPGVGVERARPAIYFIHGGGMMVGDRLTGIERVLDWVEEFDAVGVSVEYRLAPEHPHPAPVEDCYAGLAWLFDHADELGVDRTRILVCGVSAGGGLAAGTALLARDRSLGPILGQLLLCPMLDDRNDSASAIQFAHNEFWDWASNRVAWSALLGSAAGGRDVSPYAAPARALDLAGLPPTFVDVGSAELFRDESIDFAHRLLAAGVAADLHVWQGGFHEFDALYPSAAISRAAVAARTGWVARMLGRFDETGPEI